MYLEDAQKQLLAMLAEKPYLKLQSEGDSDDNPSEIMQYLIKKGLAREVDINDLTSGEEYPLAGQSLYAITEDGRAYLAFLAEQKRSSRRERIRYFITTAIAVLALVMSAIALFA